MFTNTDKMKCAEREVGFRKRVFARRVEKGQMTQAQADRETALMQAIADDYRDKVAAEQMSLGL